MKIFLNLVESNATVKQYQKALGFKGGDVRQHIKWIAYYRMYLKMTDEVMELVKKKKGSTLLERTKVRMEIRQLRATYKPILSKMRAVE